MMRGGAFCSGGRFAFAQRLLDVQLRFEAVERNRFDVFLHGVAQRRPVDLRLFGRGRELRVA